LSRYTPTIGDGSVQLVYLDPPFFTQKEHSLRTRDNSAVYSFEDRWSSLDDYLFFMKEALIECRRILKDSGSIFLHCDKRASHHLRFLLDQVFGSDYFQSEIVWTYYKVRALLDQLKGVNHLIASLLYGSGLRLMEALRLRVKDIESHYNQIIVRDGKGAKDRRTMLPASLKDRLRDQLKRARVIHQSDLREGFGAVHLPYALERKYLNASREWAWQYVFPCRLAFD
jgi:integrase